MPQNVGCYQYLGWHVIRKNTIPQVWQGKWQKGKLTYISFMNSLKVRIIKLGPKYEYVIAISYLDEQIL